MGLGQPFREHAAQHEGGGRGFPLLDPIGGAAASGRGVHYRVHVAGSVSIPSVARRDGEWPGWPRPGKSFARIALGENIERGGGTEWAPGAARSSRADLE